jgi:integrase
MSCGKPGRPGSAGRSANTTINRTIALLAQILDVAVEYDLIDSNPARGRRRRLTANRPARAYLDSAAQMAALLAAAAELDNEARPDRRHVARRPLLATLVFAGLRIGELLELRWSDVNLASGWISVRDAKTPAGVRKVKIRPALREELASYKAGASHTGPKSFVFGTSRSTSVVEQRTLTSASSLYPTGQRAAQAPGSNSSADADAARSAA